MNKQNIPPARIYLSGFKFSRLEGKKETETNISMISKDAFHRFSAWVQVREDDQSRYTYCLATITDLSLFRENLNEDFM